MAKAVRGIYENGDIRLFEDPQVKGRHEVYVVFPEGGKPPAMGIPASAFRMLDGIVSLGGDALKDSERLWEENLSAPNHH